MLENLEICSYKTFCIKNQFIGNHIRNQFDCKYINKRVQMANVQELIQNSVNQSSIAMANVMIIAISVEFI